MDNIWNQTHLRCFSCIGKPCFCICILSAVSHSRVFSLNCSRMCASTCERAVEAWSIIGSTCSMPEIPKRRRGSCVWGLLCCVCLSHTHAQLCNIVFRYFSWHMAHFPHVFFMDDCRPTNYCISYAIISAVNIYSWKSETIFSKMITVEYCPDKIPSYYKFRVLYLVKATWKNLILPKCPRQYVNIQTDMTWGFP